MRKNGGLISLKYIWQDTGKLNRIGKGYFPWNKHKVMICTIMGIDLANLHKIRQDNAGISVFEYKNNSFTTILLNDTCHLAYFK